MWRIWRRDPFRSNIVDCRWQRTPDGWKLWVHDRPRIAGSGANFSAARDALEAGITASASDLDAVLPIVPEFWPPLPATALAQRYLQPSLLSVRGDGIFEAVRNRDLERRGHDPRGNQSPLFRDGICSRCLRGRGPRTDAPIPIRSAPPHVHGGWIRGGPADLHRVYSEQFLSLLSEPERAALSLRPVEMPKGDRRTFFELLGPARVEHVGVRDLQSDAHCCAECGARSVRVLDPRLREGGFLLAEFVAAADLQSPLPSLLTVGDGNRATLCFPQERWAQLRNDRRASGLATEPIGVVDPAECERSPRVRNRIPIEACEACSRWPSPRTVSGEDRFVFELPAKDCRRENFTWLSAAEREGHLQIVCATMAPLELFERSQRPGPPEHTECVGVRCPRCWRLVFRPL